MHRKPQASNRTNRLRHGSIILTKHSLQVIHHNMHIIVTGYRHEKPKMNHIVPSLQLFRHWLENVKLGQRHIRSIPLLRRVLLVRNVKAIDMSLRKLAAKLSNPDTIKMQLAREAKYMVRAIVEIRRMVYLPSTGANVCNAQWLLAVRSAGQLD